MRYLSVPVMALLWMAMGAYLGTGHVILTNPTPEKSAVHTICMLLGGCFGLLMGICLFLSDLVGIHENEIKKAIDKIKFE
jgi:hypothetical protein